MVVLLYGVCIYGWVAARVTRTVRKDTEVSLGHYLLLMSVSALLGFLVAVVVGCGSPTEVWLPCDVVDPPAYCAKRST